MRPNNAIVKLSEKEKQALRIIAAYKGIRARGFARKLWPDHHVHQPGRSSYHSKRGMWLCAGSFVGKLIKKGLAWKEWKGGYKISEKGKAALAAKENIS